MRYVIIRGEEEIPVEIEESEHGYSIRIGETSYEVDSVRVMSNLYSLIVNGASYEVSIHRQSLDQYMVHLFDGSRPVTLMSPLAIALKRQRGEASDAGGAVRAPMPGRVVKLLAQVGDTVKKGQGIMVVEAMKMQNELQAPFDGTVKEIRVEEGASVDRNVDLAMIEQVPGGDQAIT